MILTIFLKGLAIGFSIAAPVGPIGFLCIRTTLTQGRKAGFMIGAGAAAADTTYAILGIFFLALVKGFIEQYAFCLRVVGGVFLLVLGARTFFSTELPSADVKVSATKMLAGFSSSFFLTLTNPMTIFAFIA